MKAYLLTIGLLVFNLIAYSQNIYQIRADSVRIYNDCDTAELIIENHTQTVPGYLYNKGLGRTEFRRMRFIDLGLGLIAIGDQDTLDLTGALTGSFIRNQYSAPQNAKFWVGGDGRIDGNVTLGMYKNNSTEDSVLTTDENGNLKFKLMSGGGGSGFDSSIYNSDGELTGDRYFMQNGYQLEFNNGGSFQANGTWMNQPYRFGTYMDPMQNEGLVMEYGPNRIAVEAAATRFRSQNYYYQMTITNDGVLTYNATIEKGRIGYNAGHQGTEPFKDVTLDVIADNPYRGFRLADGSQAPGRILMSNAGGYATWQDPQSLGSTMSPVLTTTSSILIGATEHTVFANNTTDITVSLPQASANSGRTYVIKKINSAVAKVTINSSYGDAIEGGSSYIINMVNKAVQFQSNGTAWFIIGAF